MYLQDELQPSHEGIHGSTVLLYRAAYLVLLLVCPSGLFCIEDIPILDSRCMAGLQVRRPKINGEVACLHTCQSPGYACMRTSVSGFSRSTDTGLVRGSLDDYS